MRKRLTITGLVQGVGFRPFIYRLATEKQLTGWVKNTTEGVEIEVEGSAERLDLFIASLAQEKPAHSSIRSMQIQPLADQDQTGFFILASKAPNQAVPLISPDIATCPECLREIHDSSNRRYRYPFTNCTSCGPRYTIIRQAPYDRQTTTMNAFSMCEKCLAEYGEVTDRRFHAQPNACPVCGPAYRLANRDGRLLNPSNIGDVFSDTRRLIQQGYIVAIKGLGGFHLACNAMNETAVAELRRRKLREDKPFAVMVGSITAAKKRCRLSPHEESLLSGPIRPIVLVDKSSGYDLAKSIAPCNPRVGIMLPYTPAHELLLNEEDFWVMTSGNLSDEPIAYEENDAFARLSSIADYFLLHNREIHRRTDDSVVRIVRNEPYFFRRSRGYTPMPIELAKPVAPILACGGDLKSAFCLTQDRQAFVSAHIGDLENLSTYRYFSDSVKHYESLFHIQPQWIAHDLHPEYLSSQYAMTRDLPRIGIQHHHAHIASVLAEHSLDEPVLGVAFDGTGYGTDGTIWGGEFLVADSNHFSRAAHLLPLPLPGSSLAIRHPWRISAFILHELYGDRLASINLPFTHALPPEWPAIVKAARLGIQSPLTSSAGRLFDAAAALLSLRRSAHYEGQAAIELEMAAGTNKGEILPYKIIEGYPKRLDFFPVFDAMVRKLLSGEDIGHLAASFHVTLAHASLDTLLRIKKDTGLTKVALSGGVFQNLRLLEELTTLLEKSAFEVYRHRLVPPNDGGLALGQTLIAGKILN